MNASSPIRAPLPLTMASEGRSLRIVDMAQSPRYRSRLADLGLTGGAIVSVVQRGGSDPYLLAINGARIAIGAGLASKILVTELDG